MYPTLFEMARDFLAFRRQADIHLSTVARHMVNHYFRKTTSIVSQDQGILLYTSSKYVQGTMQMMTILKKGAPVVEEECKVLMIAPDTASMVTRPPIDLLMVALSDVLVACPNLIVYILPSYTETTRSRRLLKVLSKSYSHRVFLMPVEPRSHLLETAAIIDQANVFVTGDTGVMHLAVARKELQERDDMHFAPKNSVKIIALFGGTSPSYFGYSRRTTIVGWGRKEHIALRLGFAKESYHLRGRNLFDHISSQQIVDAILAHIDG
jgi:hypothetical protein